MPSEKRLLRRAVLDDSGLERVKARHPWLFRGNLRQVPHCNQGDLIAFTNMAGEIQGWGLWSDSALCIRVLSFGSHEPEQMSLLRERLERAWNWRRTASMRRRAAGSAMPA